MAMERPDMEPELQRDLLIVDYVLTVCFAAESGLKVFVFGFRRYIRERTNQLDFLRPKTARIGRQSSPVLLISTAVLLS